MQKPVRPQPFVLAATDHGPMILNHLDYRALPDFARALTRQQSSGADVCLVGMSAYLRTLFDVAGQGPTLRRLEWNAKEESGARHR